MSASGENKSLSLWIRNVTWRTEQFADRKYDSRRSFDIEGSDLIEGDTGHGMEVEALQWFNFLSPPWHGSDRKKQV